MTLLPPNIRTVIIPAAGKGTRMLPVTRVTAKELLPIYDRLVIEFAIEEATAVGAERIIVVVSASKPAIREFLGNSPVVPSGRGNGTDRTGASPEIVFVTQNEPLGLGHAILCCKGLTLPGPFGVILPDDVILGKSCLPEMAKNYQGGHMIAAMKVAEQDTCKYGIFALSGPAFEACMPVTGIVEKPPHGQAPSSIAAVGRYILLPMIFDVLAHTTKGAGGELQLTDAIAVATRCVPLTAFRFSGSRYDCGTHDGLLAASNARHAAASMGLMTAQQYVARPSEGAKRNGKANGSDCAGLPIEPTQYAV